MATGGVDWTTGDQVVKGRFRNADVTTLDDTGTPTVAENNLFVTGGTTTITDFDDGVIGQKIMILAAHTVTIEHDGSDICLSANTDFDMEAGDTLTLCMFTDQVWHEIARMEIP